MENHFEQEEYQLSPNNASNYALKGTSLWALNQFRTDILVSLMDDLVILENQGLSNEQCNLVQTALEIIVNRATALPDYSFFKKSIWQILQKFEDTYRQWNEITGHDTISIEKRRKAIKKMRHFRNRLATKIRKNQFILAKELDLKLIKDFYDAFGELVKTLPAIFKELSKAVSRYSNKF